MTPLDVDALRDMVELIPLFCFGILALALLVPMLGGLLSVFVRWFFGER